MKELFVVVVYACFIIDRRVYTVSCDIYVICLNVSCFFILFQIKTPIYFAFPMLCLHITLLFCSIFK